MIILHFRNTIILARRAHKRDYFLAIWYNLAMRNIENAPAAAHMKNLPNALTCLRLLFAALLVLPAAFSPAFYALYALCGLTDVLDGYLARRLHAASAAGARLDSIADFVFTVVLLLKILPRIAAGAFLPFAAAGVAAVKLASLVVGFVRFQQAAYLHTVLNKLTGLAIFFGVALAGLLPAAPIYGVCCALAFLASLEELILLARMPALDRDRKGLLFS